MAGQNVLHGETYFWWCITCFPLRCLSDSLQCILTSAAGNNPASFSDVNRSRTASFKTTTLWQNHNNPLLVAWPRPLTSHPNLKRGSRSKATSLLSCLVPHLPLHSLVLPSLFASSLVSLFPTWPRASSLCRLGFFFCSSVTFDLAVHIPSLNSAPLHPLRPFPPAAFTAPRRSSPPIVVRSPETRLGVRAASSRSPSPAKISPVTY